MSGDLNSVNLKRERNRGREIESLRKRYVEHREAVTRLAADAPTEFLAKRYDELRLEIDNAIAKLNELERGLTRDNDTRPTGPLPPVAPPQVTPGTQNFDRMRYDSNSPLTAGEEPNTGLRTALILGIGLFVLAGLGYSAWRIFRGEEEPPRAARPAVTAPAPTISEAAEPSAITVTPVEQDFGVVRKGTRSVRQIELTNTTAKEMSIMMERSACRCLWFEYPEKVAANETTTLTIIV